MKEINMNTNNCEACGKDNLPVTVASSTIGAISFRYCYFIWFKVLSNSNNRNRYRK